MQAKSSPLQRTGFTLIELLVVIAIIGLLAGLLLPVIMNAANTASKGAIKLEVGTVEQAVNQYRAKYGDYPPDGSSWPIVERHLRRLFPRMLQSELDLLNPAITDSAGATLVVNNDFLPGNVRVMDPAEALVFFLGGFSNDPQRPLTGTGGPFKATSVANVLQYNPQRTGGSMDFKLNQLSLVEIPNPSMSTETIFVSNDDSTYFQIANDLLPVYVHRSGDITTTAPMVYFDARTYVFGAPASPFVNFYQRTPYGSYSAMVSNASNAGVSFGAIRPLVSSKVRVPQVLPIGSRTTLQWLKTNLFIEDTKFQVLSPGLDGKYGGRLGQEVDLSSTRDRCEAMLVMPGGFSYVPDSVPGASSAVIFDNWKLPRGTVNDELHYRAQGMDDNAGNVGGRTFAETIVENL